MEGSDKILEKQPELISSHGRVRSKEDEEALDKKIAEIRKKNQLIEQRKEVRTIIKFQLYYYQLIV